MMTTRAVLVVLVLALGTRPGSRCLLWGIGWLLVGRALSRRGGGEFVVSFSFSFSFSLFFLSFRGLSGMVFVVVVVG